MFAEPFDGACSECMPVVFDRGDKHWHLFPGKTGPVLSGPVLHKREESHSPICLNSENRGIITRAEKLTEIFSRRPNSGNGRFA